jgi:hypothetical protein
MDRAPTPLSARVGALPRRSSPCLPQAGTHMAGLGLVLSCCFASCQAADISVSGIWSPVLSAADLAGGAGTDLRSSLESASGQGALAVSNTGGASWEVMVRSDGAVAPAGVTLFVRIAAVGSGAGTVAATGTYVRLDGSARTLISGSGERSGVQLQYKLVGASVRNAVGSYSSTIIYSIQ